MLATPSDLTLELTDIASLLRDRAQQQPDRRAYTFLEDGEEQTAHLTYGDLDRQARAIAARIQAVAPPQTPVLLLYPQGLEFVSAFFGCAYAGVPAVPAYPPRRNQKTERLRAIVADSGAQVALTVRRVWEDVHSGFADTPDLSALEWVATDEIAVGNGDAWQAPTLSPDMLAFLQYTSGSTGTPKGVMVTHANILHNSETIRRSFGLSENSVSVTWLPSFHDMGLIDGILQPFYSNFLGVIMSPAAFLQKPRRWLQAIARYGATHCGGPNLGYDLCATKISPEQRAGLDLSRWHSAYSGAEPVRKQTLDRFAQTFAPYGFKPEFFYPCYGLAEATLMVSGGDVNAPPVSIEVDAAALERNQIELSSEGRPLVGCGRAWLDTDIAIVDPETQTKVEGDRVGEIWVSGGSVAQGYWQRNDATVDTFQARLPEKGDRSYLRTGDLGCLREGELFVTGRMKDVIILWGRNHYPQDIELTVEQSHPALRPGCGAAFSLDVEGQERLAIVQEVERTALRHLPVDEVVKTIREAISAQHDIAVYGIQLIKTASIPKTSSGKIQRFACQRGFQAHSLAVVGEWTQPLTAGSLESATPAKPEIPSSEEAIQDWLIAQLALATGVDADDIELDEPFANYGLDSSVALSLTGTLGEWLGCDLEPTLFWEYTSIETLAAHLYAIARP